jgi:hypothetical protein
MKLAPAVLAALVAVAAAAPPALADDASVVAAYDARQTTDLPAAGQAYQEARRRFDRVLTIRAARRVIRTDQALNTVLRRIAGEVAAQTVSSARGDEGRLLALREIRAWVAANRLEIRAFRVWMRGSRARANRLIGRANRTFLHGERLGRRAVRAFTDTGHAPPHGSVIDGKPLRP